MLGLPRLDSLERHGAEVAGRLDAQELLELGDLAARRGVGNACVEVGRKIDAGYRGTGGRLAVECGLDVRDGCGVSTEGL